MPLGKPMPHPTGDEKWIFLPWDQIDWPDVATPFLVGMSIASVVAYALYRLAVWLTERNTRRAECARAVRHCQERHLSALQIRIVWSAIVAAKLKPPAMGVMSRPYFDRFLAPILAKRVDNAMCEEIRDRLFGELRAPEHPHENGPISEVAVTDLPGTRLLQNGAAVRLHFRNIPGRYHAMVVAADAESFTVVLPQNQGSSLPIEAGGRVEGVFKSGVNAFVFVSTVLEALPGELAGCRIAHTVRLLEAHHRESVRVAVMRPVQFHHVSTAGPARSAAAPTGPLCAGTLVDISLGGCSIRTDLGRAFRAEDRLLFEVAWGARHHFRFTGAIRRVEPDGPEAQQLEVVFVGVDDSTRQELAHAIYELDPTKI